MSTLEAVLSARSKQQRATLEVSRVDFRFPTVLGTPMPEDPVPPVQRVPISASARQPRKKPTPQEEWDHFKKGLQNRRSFNVRAVAGGVGIAEKLPPLTSGPPHPPFLPPTPRESRTQMPFLSARPGHDGERLAAAIDYNFVETRGVRAKRLIGSARQRWSNEDAEDDYIYEPVDAYAIAVRGVAAARQHARALDRQFVAQLAFRDAVPAIEPIGAERVLA